MSQHPQAYLHPDANSSRVLGPANHYLGQWDLSPRRQALIAHPVRDRHSIASFAPLLPQDLATNLEADGQLAETFLTTAVMVALADGIYLTAEKLLQDYVCRLRHKPSHARHLAFNA